MRIARALQRALGDDCRQVGAGSASLEVTLERGDPARVREAALLADGALRAHPVPQAAPFEAPAVRAFLDGVKESRVVAYAGTLPSCEGAPPP